MVTMVTVVHYLNASFSVLSVPVRAHSFTLAKKQEGPLASAEREMRKSVMDLGPDPVRHQTRDQTRDHTRDQTSD